MKINYLLIGLIFLLGCKQNPKEIKSSANIEKYQLESANPEFLHRAMRSLTDAIILDVFSPPVSSRIYVYSSIAAYEAMRHLKPGYASMAHQLNGLEDLPKPDSSKTYCYPLAALEAFYKTANIFIFSKEVLDETQKKLMAEMNKLNIPEDVFKNSIAYGDTLAAKIKPWVMKDNYKNLSNKSNYTTTYKPGSWIPTWPGYDPALEPFWCTMRTMAMDSCNQFRAAPPFPFSKDKKSDFYKQAYDVYTIGKNLTPEQSAIAKFWDDNPAVLNETGHMMIKRKKMTPNGHWLNIIRQASEKSKMDILSSSEAYMLASMGMYDGFITCWYEKFENKVIRPISYITEYIDPNWRPFLVTPPFPEHTSGHSVISGAAGEICTYIFGDNFKMVDSTENEFGHGVRSIESFRKAVEEVSISRVYGGIHYKRACEEGVKQGIKIGNNVLQKIKTRPSSVGVK
ncbi:MAG TPA: vanadium-dependent haloperoxidase [Saprospiraceae bacterium]|nr:vanadium-dependent haloperoxidase [Saprospiraceae bacterium]